MGAEGLDKKWKFCSKVGEYRKGKGKNINGMKWRFKESCLSFKRFHLFICVCMQMCT